MKYKPKKYVKSAIKKAIGKRNYRFISWGLRRFGVLWTIGELLKWRGGNIAKVKLPKNGYHACIRVGTSDQSVYDQVWFNSEFNVDVNSPRLVVDAGAHIGLVSQYFALKYPKAKIVSLEPNDENFELLKRNTKHLKNVYPIKAALWHKSCKIKAENPGAKEPWSFRFVEADKGDGLEAITISQIVDKFECKKINILKMDIEGAEKEILNTHHEWISSVEFMMIELHDRYRHGCSDAMYNMVEKNNLSVASYGSREVGETVHVI